MEEPLFLVVVVIGMERWESEGVLRYKIGKKRMCALSQLKSCQGAGAYKLQARDKRQLCLSGCFPLHLSCPFSHLLSSPCLSLLLCSTSINQTGNVEAACSVILTLTRQMPFPPLTDKDGPVYLTLFHSAFRAPRLFRAKEPVHTSFSLHLGYPDNSTKLLLEDYWSKNNVRYLHLLPKSTYSQSRKVTNQN